MGFAGFGYDRWLMVLLGFPRFLNGVWVFYPRYSQTKAAKQRAVKDLSGVPCMVASWPANSATGALVKSKGLHPG